MKVALVAYDHTRLKFLQGIFDKINGTIGCQVTCFTHHGDPKGTIPHVAHPWGEFRYEKIDEYKPDVVVMFNGFATETLPATTMLREKYPVFHVEQGWLPQKGNIYIDKLGTGARSIIARRIQELRESKVDDFDMGMAIGELKASYRNHNTFKNPHPGKKFVVVPMQLEHDTSIIYDSPVFKTMNSLIAYLRKAFKNTPYDVIVKSHPREKEKSWRAADGLLTERHASLNDMIAHQDCAGVVGINSTSLIEALVHQKPVICLGRNVASGTGAYALELHDDGGNFGRFSSLMLDAINNYTPTNEALHVLYSLSKLQFPRTNIPDWVYKFLKEQRLNVEWLL